MAYEFFEIFCTPDTFSCELRVVVVAINFPDPTGHIANINKNFFQNQTADSLLFNFIYTKFQRIQISFIMVKAFRFFITNYEVT